MNTIGVGGRGVIELGISRNHRTVDHQIKRSVRPINVVVLDIHPLIGSSVMIVGSRIPSVGAVNDSQRGSVPIRVAEGGITYSVPCTTTNPSVS